MGARLLAGPGHALADYLLVVQVLLQPQTSELQRTVVLFRFG